MTSSVRTRTMRGGFGLTALAAIGIILGSVLLGASVSRTAAVDQKCERPLDVVLIIDRSGSMGETQGIHTRLGWAKIAATQFVDALDANGGVNGSSDLHQVGLTSYGGAAATVDHALGSSDAATLDLAINGLSASGVTPLKQGMAAGLGDMNLHQRSDVDGVSVTHVLILLSDGRPNPDSTGAGGSRPDSTEIAAYLAGADKTFGIAIGAGGTGFNNPDLVLMQALSKPAPNFYHVVDAGSLPNLFSTIAEDLLCGDIHITKTPAPAGPVAPGTSVTYTYQVTNSSNDTPITNVVVTDDQCSPVSAPTKSGGDSDALLEFGETWTYACTMPLEHSTKNEACADGDFIGGGHDSDCADVTVEVIPNQPSIKITKSHDPAGPVEPGTKVTYTYEVENTGNTPLTDVKVTDLVAGTADVACDVDSDDFTGDGNDNDVLDVGETWTFSCSTNLAITTENKACVSAVPGDQPPLVDLKAADLAPVELVKDCDNNTVEVSQSPEGSPEGSVEAGTGTPAATQPNTSLGGLSGGVLPTILFSLLLITSLGTLAYANVRSLRRRS